MAKSRAFFCLLMTLAASSGCRSNAELRAPELLSPPTGSVFNEYPRTVSASWRAVPGARSYTLEVDYLNCGGDAKWCGDDSNQAGRTYIVKDIKDTTQKFDFVGAQPGRWRVWAVNADNVEGPKSTWWEFRYTK